MNEEVRHTTLRDYLATIRRRRKPILLIALSGVIAGLAISLVQDKTYTGEGSFRVKNVSESLSLAGLLADAGELPAQTAAQGAETATAPAVMERVREDLGVGDSVDELRSRVEAEQEPQSNLITVTADAPTANEAAELTNAVTASAVAVANERAQREFSQLAAELRDRARRLGTGGGIQEATDNLTQRNVLIDQAARLEAASAVADLADVATEATPPTSPSAPKPITNSIIGGIVGLLIGLIAAGVLESLDRRLRRPDEVQEALDLPLIGIVADSAMGAVPISEDGVAEEDVAAMDAYRMLQTNLTFLGSDQATPRTVLVTSPLPEEGKTSVSLGLALASAVAGQSTLLVEADFHRPVHAERLGLDPEPGLADYLSGDAKPRSILQTLQFTDPGVVQYNGRSPQNESLLACITAGNRDHWSGEMLNSRHFGDFIRQVQKVYDLVVIDSGPILAVAETLQIVPHVDSILFCVRLGKTTREQAKAGREALARLPDRLTGLVTTGVTPADSDGYSYYSYAYSYRFGQEESRHRERSETGA